MRHPSLLLCFVVAGCVAAETQDLPDAQPDAQPDGGPDLTRPVTLTARVVDTLGRGKPGAILVLHDGDGKVIGSARGDTHGTVQTTTKGFAAVTIAAKDGLQQWHLTTMWGNREGEEIVVRIPDPALHVSVDLTLPGLAGNWEYFTRVGGCLPDLASSNLAAAGAITRKLSFDQGCVDEDGRFGVTAIARQGTTYRYLAKHSLPMGSGPSVAVDLSGEAWAEAPHRISVNVWNVPAPYDSVQATVLARRGALLFPSFPANQYRAPDDGRDAELVVDHVPGLAEGYRVVASVSTETTTWRHELAVTNDEDASAGAAVIFDGASMVMRSPPRLTEAETARPIVDLDLAASPVPIDGVRIRTVQGLLHWDLLVAPRDTVVVPELPDSLAEARPAAGAPMTIEEVEVWSGGAFDDAADFRRQAGHAPVPAAARFAVERYLAL